MKSALLFAALPLLLAFAPQPVLAVDTHQDHAAAQDSHHAAAPTAAKPAPAKGWATDAPLRAGMGRIRQAVDALGHYERGHMGAEQAVVLAGNIEADVNFLIANCKLDPAADAALHGIIAKLLQGAHALKANPSDLAAIAPMREAVAEYGRTFDDPGFAKDAAAH